MSVRGKNRRPDLMCQRVSLSGSIARRRLGAATQSHVDDVMHEDSPMRGGCRVLSFINSMNPPATFVSAEFAPQFRKSVPEFDSRVHMSETLRSSTAIRNGAVAEYRAKWMTVHDKKGRKKETFHVNQETLRRQSSIRHDD